jgi:hypothetical protein
VEFKTLQHMNQAMHVQIPEVNFCESVSFVHFRTISAVRGCSSDFCSITISEECSKCWFGYTNSWAVRNLAASDKYPLCFQLRRGFRDRLRWGKSRGIGKLGKLRQE